MTDALLIGREPDRDLGFSYVDRPPYEAVVLGSLSPGQLLWFREDRVLEALEQGLPVYLYTPGLPRTEGCEDALRARYQGALGDLRDWGVVLIQGPPRPFVNERRANRDRLGPIPPGALLTPLAKEVLEEKRKKSWRSER